MSLQWNLVAGFLFSEIVVVLLLSFPILSPSKLHKLFKSKFLKAILHQSKKYFGFILFGLVLFLCDSVRELRKYSDISADDRDKYAHLDAEMLIQLRLFRAQRNFYVCGFALVLSVVIQRLITLINEQAALLKAVKNRHQPADDEKSDQLTAEDTHHEHLEGLHERIADLEWKLKREMKNKESVRSMSREYIEAGNAQSQPGNDKKSK